MRQWKRVLGIVLAWCALSSVCAMGAESTLERNRNQTHGKSYCGGHHSDKIWCLLVSAEGVRVLPYLGR